MRFQELFDTEDTTYDIVLQRFSRNEKLMRRFILGFVDDPVYEQVIQSMQNNNYDQALQSTHALKGICLNMGFVRLGQTAATIVEQLRASKFEEVQQTMPKLQQEYEQVIAKLKQVQD